MLLMKPETYAGDRFCWAILRILKYKWVDGKPLNSFKQRDVGSVLYYRIVVLATVCREDWRGQSKSSEFVSGVL